MKRSEHRRGWKREMEFRLFDIRNDAIEREAARRAKQPIKKLVRRHERRERKRRDEE